jgi:hypothetical protein
MTSPSIVPGYRPKMPREWVTLLPSVAPIGREKMNGATVYVVGRRGFFLDMGKRRVNDRALYDDAIWVVSPRVCVGFNANCDPQHYRPEIANLVPGVWLYRVGKHKRNSPDGYTALVQAEVFTVARDGKTQSEAPRVERGWQGINIHKGGEQSTWSLGCQTIYGPQYDEFIGLVQKEATAYGEDLIPYALTEKAA